MQQQLATQQQQIQQLLAAQQQAAGQPSKTATVAPSAPPQDGTNILGLLMCGFGALVCDSRCVCCVLLGPPAHGQARASQVPPMEQNSFCRHVLSSDTMLAHKTRLWEPHLRR